MSRVKSWTAATLSYVGRLQLIKSILFSIQVYWSSLFCLPRSTLKKMDSTLSAFLWKGSSLSTSGAKVAWAKVCLPKQEGGLGIMRLKDWNKAATIKHIWRLLTVDTSIWTSWIHKVLLKRKPFWLVQSSNYSSWCWRKMLQSRSWCRGFIRSTIGDGKNTNLWLDNWLPQGPLHDLFSSRTIASTRLPLDAKVSEIISNGAWNFPNGDTELDDLWPTINFLPRIHCKDELLWNNSPKFTIKAVWEAIRARGTASALHHSFWFKDHIPRHAFIHWLACYGRLQTTDRLVSWGIPTTRSCMLCKELEESHDHLFFRCNFADEVWMIVRAKTFTEWPHHSIWHLTNWTAKYANRKGNIEDTIRRLALSATTYAIWHERNSRTFDQKARPSYEVARSIVNTIRERLLFICSEHAVKIPAHVQNTWSLKTT